jgi:hypothetical protein
MKKHMVAVAIFAGLLMGVTTMAQNKADDKYANRYKLDIPKDWIKKPRLMRAITNILPLTLTQLKELDFCTEGKAAYTVKIFIGRIRVQNDNITTPIQQSGRITYTHTFNYSYYSGLMLYDSTGKELIMLRLTDPKETYQYRREYSKAQKRLHNNTEVAMVNDIQTLPAYNSLLRDGATVNKLPAHTAKSVLTNDFLLKICEEKVFEIQKILRSLSSLQ